jgi:MFS family permease
MRYLMWLSALLFFAFQLIIRMWLGINTDFIMHQFSIDVDVIGKLASYYYFGYAICQIPVAILLEKFGSQKTISTAAILCGISHLIFTNSDNINIAFLCRFIIGACSACGFLGVSKVITEWFDKTLYSKMVAYSFTLGFLGTIIGGKPMIYLIHNFDHNLIANSLGIIAIIIGLLCFALLKKKDKKSISVPFKAAFFIELIKNKFILGMMIVMFCMVGIVEVYADMWAINHVMVTYNLAKNNAAGLVSFITYISKITNEQNVMFFSGILYSMLLYILLFAVVKNVTIVSIICFLLGIVCCFKVIIFSICSKAVSNTQLGLTIAMLNSANMLGGSFINNVIGRLMSAMWDGKMNDMQVKIYDVTAYQYSLSVIIYSVLIGAFISYLVNKIYLKKNKDCN